MKHPKYIISILLLLGSLGVLYPGNAGSEEVNRVNLSTGVPTLVPGTTSHFEIVNSTGEAAIIITEKETTESQGSVAVSTGTKELIVDTTNQYEINTSTKTDELLSGATLQYELKVSTAELAAIARLKEKYRIKISTEMWRLLPGPTTQYEVITDTSELTSIPYRFLVSNEKVESVPDDYFSFSFKLEDFEIKGSEQEKVYNMPDKFILPGSLIVQEVESNKSVETGCEINYALGRLEFRELLPATSSYRVRYACFPFKPYTEFVAVDRNYLTGSTEEMFKGLEKDLSFRMIKKEYEVEGGMDDEGYYLEDELIVPEDEIVWFKKYIRKVNTDYSMDYYNGKICFTVPSTDTDTFRIRYSCLPFKIITRGAAEFFVDISIEELLSQSIAEGTEKLNLYSAEETFEGKNDIGPYVTTNKHILRGTEIIKQGDKLYERDKDYTIDYQGGKIIFEEPMPPDSKFQVSYQHFPFDLADFYGRKKEVSQGGESIAIKSSFSQKKEYKSELTLGGGFTLEMKFTEGQTPSLNQSLRLDASGNITEDVKVKMIVSDQSMPLQPEGNTAVIEEMDKMFAEVTIKESVLTLGDYNVSFRGGEFNNYTKKLEGVKASIVLEQANIDMFTASSAGGGYTTVEIQNVRNAPGPYRVINDGVIKAGTETVWLDDRSSGLGLQKMTRGTNNDYTIDYDAAEITFTPKEGRQITSNMKIVVDFEYNTSYYDRSTFGMRAESKSLLGDKVKLGATLLRESDDIYSNEDLYSSGSSSDTSNKNWTEDGIFISSNTLETIQGENSNRTKLNVSSPTLNMPLLPAPPMAHSIVSLDGKMNLGKISMDGEVAFSNKDKNTLSGKVLEVQVDDPLRKIGGIAGKMNFSSNLQNIKLGKIKLGNINWRGKLRYEGTDFLALGKSVPVKFTDKWDVTASQDKPTRLTLDTSMKYTPLSILSFTPSLGIMRETFMNEASTDVIRINENRSVGVSGISLNLPKLLLLPGSAKFTGYYDNLTKNTSYYTGHQSSSVKKTEREKWQAQGDYNIWKLNARSSWHHETNTNLNFSSSTPVSRGSSINDVYKWGSSLKELLGLTASFDREDRVAYIIDADTVAAVSKRTEDYRNSSEEWTNKVGFAFKPGRGTYFLTDLTFSDREVTTYGIDSSSSTTNSKMVNLRMNYNPKLLRKAIRTTLNYKLNNRFNVAVSTRIQTEISSSLKLKLDPGALVADLKNGFFKDYLMKWSIENNISLTEKTEETSDMDMVFLRDRIRFGRSVKGWGLNNISNIDGRFSDVFRHKHIIRIPWRFINLTMDIQGTDNATKLINEYKNNISYSKKYTCKLNPIKTISFTPSYELKESTNSSLSLNDANKSTSTYENKSKLMVTSSWQVFRPLKISYSGNWDSSSGKLEASYRDLETGKLTATLAIQSGTSLSATFDWKYENYTKLGRINKNRNIKMDLRYRIGKNVNGSAWAKLNRRHDKDKVNGEGEAVGGWTDWLFSFEAKVQITF